MVLMKSAEKNWEVTMFYMKIIQLGKQISQLPYDILQM